MSNLPAYQIPSSDDEEGFIPSQLNATNNRINYAAGSSSQPVGPSTIDQDLNTLDEPLMETLSRDFGNIWQKIKLVLVPKGQNDILKSWDLWGPLLLCLTLALTLSITDWSQADKIFSGVFVIVPLGSAIITLNAQLLGGKLSFFQTTCVLGYCVFPVNVASIVCAFLAGKGVLKVVIRLLVVAFALAWCILASTGFLKSNLGLERKKALALFPIFLFYFTLCYMVLIFSSTFSYSPEDLLEDSNSPKNDQINNTTSTSLLTMNQTL